jgi:hypothetical protein
MKVRFWGYVALGPWWTIRRWWIAFWMSLFLMMVNVSSVVIALLTHKLSPTIGFQIVFGLWFFLGVRTSWKRRELG